MQKIQLTYRDADTPYLEMFRIEHADITFASISSMVYLFTVFRLDQYRTKHKISFPNKYRILASWWFWFIGLYSAVSFSVLTPVPFFLDIKASSFCRATITPIWVQKWVEHVMRVFFWSKIIEFGDTIWFILSNRSQVKFLQWFHHLVTLWYVMYNTSWFPMTGCVFAFVNMGVHAVMYPYLAFSIHPDRQPCIPPFVITTAQILQMIVGIITIIFHHIICQPFVWDWTGMCMFMIYFFLFVEFFIERYGLGYFYLRVRPHQN